MRFDVFFVAPNVIMRPDTRSHGPFALGELVLENGERVVVLWSAPRISDEVQEQLDRVLSAEVLKDGQPVSGLGMLTFSIEDGRGVHVVRNERVRMPAGAPPDVDIAEVGCSSHPVPTGIGERDPVLGAPRSAALAPPLHSAHISRHASMGT